MVVLPEPRSEQVDAPVRESRDPNAFESLARTAPRSATADLVGFVIATRRYWLAPILIVLALFAGVLMLSATPAGPFVYTFF